MSEPEEAAAAENEEATAPENEATEPQAEQPTTAGEDAAGAEEVQQNQLVGDLPLLPNDSDENVLKNIDQRIEFLNAGLIVDEDLNMSGIFAGTNAAYRELWIDNANRSFSAVVRLNRRKRRMLAKQAAEPEPTPAADAAEEEAKTD